MTDNFICLPDPKNITEWYYLAFNIDHKEFKGGYFMGVIKCPFIISEEGKLQELKQEILKSITNMRPEAWNPGWKASQVVTGVYQFWLGSEKTYSSTYYNEFGDE